MSDALEKLAEELGPELLRELVALARLALEGKPHAEIASQAVRFATLTAYKKAYGG